MELDVTMATDITAVSAAISITTGSVFRRLGCLFSGWVGEGRETGGGCMWIKGVCWDLFL